MLAEISVGYGSLKAAVDIVRGLTATNTQIQINEVKIELQRLMLDAQSALMTAQTAQATCANEITALEQEIIRLTDWSAEKERYQLTDVRHGAMAYTVKAGSEMSEPPHWLCAQCFGQSRKSLLQNKGTTGPDATYGCDACKSSFKVPFRYHPALLSSSQRALHP